MKKKNNWICIEEGQWINVDTFREIYINENSKESFTVWALPTNPEISMVFLKGFNNSKDAIKFLDEIFLGWLDT